MSTVKLEIHRERPGLCPSLIGRWQDFKILNPGKGHDINMLLQAKGGKEELPWASRSLGEKLSAIK